MNINLTVPKRRPGLNIDYRDLVVAHGEDGNPDELLMVLNLDIEANDNSILRIELIPITKNAKHGGPYFTEQFVKLINEGKLSIVNELDINIKSYR